jgi:lipoprotein-releasing system ATP-binding protein
MAGSLIELAGVRKSYGVGTEVETEVLHGINLALAAGEFAALIGPSGSGKSTLLNLIGLLEAPSGGSYRLRGRETSSLPEAELTALRATSLGFVFQFHHLLPAFSALENVMLPLVADRGHREPWMKERAALLLEAVGLAALGERRPSQLSGGQQQRVAVARALAARPALLLADEPTGNLDTRSSDEVFELLRRFHEEEGTAVLVVTHDPRLAARCDRVLELVDGRLVRDEATP